MLFHEAGPFQRGLGRHRCERSDAGVEAFDSLEVRRGELYG
jgi:hypothetical protein